MPVSKINILQKIPDWNIIILCQKGVKNVHNYIFNLEINKDSLLVMVVDCFNTVVGWWFLWSHIVIVNIKKYPVWGIFLEIGQIFNFVTGCFIFGDIRFELPFSTGFQIIYIIKGRANLRARRII